jgi:hypothetical protein
VIIFSLVVEAIDMSEAREDLRINISLLVNLSSDLIEVLEAIMMLTKGQLLVSLRNLQKEQSIG